MKQRGKPRLWRGLSLLLGATILGAANLAGADATERPPPVPTLPPGSNRVLTAELGVVSHATYEQGVEKLLAAFETEKQRRFVPGARGRAALKVYSDSGAGLATPPDLVRAVIAALERRGFTRDMLAIVGLSAARLRESGFLPSLAVGGAVFEGVPVFTLETGRYYDAAWFYESALPAAHPGVSPPESDDGVAATEAERRSPLPAPLLFDVDFWINLPGCSDHPILGVNGALVNATLWNAGNTQRFFRSPANGPAAAAEIAAIPELRATWACTIISLERYQFIGGPVFNSLYTVSEPIVWLSDNPVMIDALMRHRINQAREAAGFRPLTNDLRLLVYGQQVGLGSGDRTQVEWVPVRLDAAP